MNKDRLKARISNNLLKVWKKSLATDVAQKEICDMLVVFAERTNGLDVQDIAKRVEEAITDFLLDVDPERPGVAIHDAIDHIFNG